MIFGYVVRIMIVVEIDMIAHHKTLKIMSQQS